MTRRLPALPFAALAAALALASVARAQPRPHVGYAYPAGGQAGTTFEVKLGGQNLDDVAQVYVTGTGVSARVVSFHRRIGPQEMQLLNEQLRLLRRAAPKSAAAPAAAPARADDDAMMMMSGPAKPGRAELAAVIADDPAQLLARVEKRVREWVQTPACASIASLAILEVTVAPEAEPGPRELRLITPRGISNPLAFHVGQFHEYARPAMLTARLQVLGKEASALRNRPADECERRIDLPCVLNGQIASGEVNRYRFTATQGQRLVFSTLARQLIPYIADAVPGWFQPVLALYDAQGRELAFDDDYQFRPDPVVFFEVPRDGEYVLEIRDAIYRGREDFVYRIAAGELPFVTRIFPLGGQVGAAMMPEMGGLNVADADLSPPPRDPRPGFHALTASRLGFSSNRVPFVLDRLPDVFEREPNNSFATAQDVVLPAAVNGRIDRPDDWDVFRFAGKAGQQVVVEVQARRLDSPLDSVVKLTDTAGNLLALSDDREDLTAGLNTHHADSYLRAKLPADGTYLVHLGDTARQGGAEFGYRLRLGPPQPDFEVRVVPSSLSLPLNQSTAVSVFVMRQDGFNGPIRVSLQNPPAGFSAQAVTIPANQTTARLSIRGGPKPTRGPVRLTVIGSATVGSRDLVRAAVPAEDKMQAFLWRHLVPAQDLLALVYDRNVAPTPRRAVPARPAVALPAAAPGTTGPEAPKPKFTKQQIAGRLRQLKLLYEEGLLTDEFYLAKVAECDTPQ